MKKKKILIVEDSNFFLLQLKDVLVEANYEVITASTGEDGLELVKKEKPDLVLLDIVLPKMNGFEVCRILREQESNNLMPIIMLTSQDHLEDKLQGLELGADDYINKPFNKRELLSRIKNTLVRIERNRSVNPLTGLCGNIEIHREIEARIAKEETFAVVYADLDNFKLYNDHYGFAKGDTVIKLTADILMDAICVFGNKTDFLGNIGGDDFIFITNIDTVDRICNSIIENFDKCILQMYSLKDAKNGFITTINRKCEESKAPLILMSLAAITNETVKFKTFQEVSNVIAKVKSKAKSIPGSVYIRDIRKSIR